MERFLSVKKPRSQSVPRSPSSMNTSPRGKMAEACLGRDSVIPTSPDERGDRELDTHVRIANAVAKLLKPTITEAVHTALQQGLNKIHTAIDTHSKSIQEAESRISSLEDELFETQAKLSTSLTATETIQLKLDDLENRSRRNNLRIVGLPESYRLQLLPKLCSELIPEALGLTNRCVIERVHRLGPPRADRPNPRPIITKYLNYADKALLLQRFRQKGSLEVEGIRLLLFADYSAEVSKKRKAFQQICSALHSKRIRFTLAYPAILRLTTQEGNTLVFQEPQDAESFIHSLEPTNESPSSSPLPPRSPRKMGKSPKRQQGTPRKSRARKKL